MRPILLSLFVAAVAATAVPAAHASYYCVYVHEAYVLGSPPPGVPNIGACVPGP